MRKILISVFTALFIFISVLCPVIALCPVNAMASQGSGSYEYVIWDDADLLSYEEEVSLSGWMELVLEYGNAIVYTTSLDAGADYERNAEQIYYEAFGREPGVIFQIDMGNRKLTLSFSTGMEDQIGSQRSSIVDNIYRYASDGDYGRCCNECFYQIYTVLNNGRIAHTMKYINNALLAVLLALVINFVIIFIGATRKKSVGSRLIAGSGVSLRLKDVSVSKGNVTKRYSPRSSSSGGSGSSGGSSGGGGGGGFSGGSSSHGF